MADWKGGGGGGPKKSGWRGRAPQGRRETRHNWKAAEAVAPGRGRRRLAVTVVGALLVAVAVGIVIWFILPKPPNKPHLVFFANNPLDTCTRLDVPMDLYGWQSAQALCEDARYRAGQEQGSRWGTYAPVVSAAPDGSPKQVPTEAELEDWAKSMHDCTRMVVYFGAHCGTGPDGPFLHAAGGERLPVKKLLEALAKGPLAEKPKILIFDPGRLDPSAVNGQLIDDFAARLHAMNEDVKQCPNLVVIVGSDDGQRVWESEEMKQTPLAMALGDALNGKGIDGEVITAWNLFGAVKAGVSRWTRGNRRPCVPFMLPEGEAGENLAKNIEVGIRPNTPSTARAPFTAYPAAVIQAAWEQHDKLAAGDPPPAAYSPRLWRRYRELLLRWEAAQRTGEAATARKLQNAFEDCEKTLVSRQLRPFESAWNSLAMQVARGLKPAEAARLPDDWRRDEPKSPPPSENDVRLALTQSGLNKLAPESAASPRPARSRLGPASTLRQLFDWKERPIEAHLPAMVEWYYAQPATAAADVPKEVFEAFEFAAIAERASLGMTPDEKGPSHFHEAVWPEIRPAILESDKMRRLCVDWLFSGDAAKHDQAQKKLKELHDSTLALARRAATQRRLLLSRARLFADAGFYSEWSVHAPSDAAKAGDQPTAWATFVARSGELDTGKIIAGQEHPDEKSLEAYAKDCEAIEAFQSAASAYRDQAKQRGSGENQPRWISLQRLLASPCIPAGDRMECLKESWRISATLLKPENQGKDPGEPDAEAAKAAIARARSQAQWRGRLALEMLGKALVNLQHEGNRTGLRDYDDIRKALDGAAASGDFNTAGTWLRDHLRTLAKPTPAGESANVEAERFSRAAVACEWDGDWEPACVNQRLRWRALLADLGRRTCLDRWYTEGAQQPYFAAAAERYFRDSHAVAAGMPGDKPFDAILKEYEDLLADRKLVMQSPPKTIKWTSERKGTATFTLGVPSKYPAEVAGEATLTRVYDQAAPLLPGDPRLTTLRELRPVKTGVTPDVIDTPLKIADTAESLTDPKCKVAVAAWFRGQRVEAPVDIEVYRRPELVFADPLVPAVDKDVAIAVRANPNLELGELVIIVDYSGSMKRSLDGATDYGKKCWENPSRIRLAVDTLEEVLKVLPEKTSLKVRVFSAAGFKKSKRIFPGEGKTPEWSRGNLKGLIDDLKDLMPDEDTPLVRSIEESLADDYPGTADRTRTMIVLTDGVDFDSREAQSEDRIRGLSGRLTNGFRGKNISLFAVNFCVSPDEERLSDLLFKKIGEHDPPGRVWSVNTQAKLKAALLEALRPKLRLDTGQGPPGRFPREGWPARPREDGDNRESLLWSDLFPLPGDGRLTALPFPCVGRIDRRLSAQDGDRFILELARGNDGRTVVRRDLYASFFDKSVKAIRPECNWVLTIPTATVDDSLDPLVLSSTLLLEKVPPRTGEEETVILQSRPEYLWWEVAPVAEGAFSTVTVRKEYGFAAPAWKLRVQNWPRNPANPREFAAPRIAVYASDARPTGIQPIDCPGLNQPYTTKFDGGDFELRADFEEHSFVPGGPMEMCLVLRALHAKDRPVWVRLAGGDGKYNAERRYYRKADAVTTIIGPMKEEEFRGRPLKLEIYPVTPLKADPQSSLELALPRPRGGKSDEENYKPKFVKPMNGG